MKLPLRDFSDVITALKGPNEKSAASEQRGAARMSVTAKINVHLLENNRVIRSFSALTRDISLTGCGLMQSVALSPNQLVILALPRPTAPLFVISHITHCRPLADGLLSVGVEFNELASKETCDLMMKSDSQEHARIRQSVLD